MQGSAIVGYMKFLIKGIRGDMIVNTLRLEVGLLIVVLYQL